MEAASKARTKGPSRVAERSQTGFARSLDAARTDVDAAAAMVLAGEEALGLPVTKKGQDGP